MTASTDRPLSYWGSRVWPYLLLLLLTTIAYFASAKAGLYLAYVAQQVSAVWPPTGLALAAVLLLGYRVWPAIAVGAFWVNVITNEPIGTALAIAAGNTLEAIAGAWLLRRLPGFTPSLDRLRDVFGLIVLGALASTAISATIGVASLCLGGVQGWSAFGEFWRVWWLGDATGALVVAPALLTWSTWRRGDGVPHRRVEAAALAFVVAVVAFVVFAGQWRFVTTDHPLEYAVFPLVIWAGLRFGPRGAASVTLVTSAVAIWGAIHRQGPFGRDPVDQGLILLQLFMGVVAVTSLFLGAVASERARALSTRSSSMWPSGNEPRRDCAKPTGTRTSYCSRSGKATAARTSSWPCSRTSCATPLHPFAMPSISSSWSPPATRKSSSAAT